MSGLEIVGPEEVCSLVFLDQVKAKGACRIVKYELVEPPSRDRLVDEPFGLLIGGRYTVDDAVETESCLYSLGQKMMAVCTLFSY